ncbi:hypothetical protein [Winogradskyella luteola]|uniref:Uncharacterized protein n=1 Tax=Winogradskyella luteola TaxID=2828330 RepID=A0A9X1JQT4_9FLAO|nr:hypothetical protein [Winogradskyella luteola]MBV7269243.1 hypothetical protein [Winogradskyella luteola]
MKLILGDNQFFGINHNDLQKGLQSKTKFGDEVKIEEFIKKSIDLGLDGFMINSNDLGYKLISNYSPMNKEEIHYSIPYPHKYASMVNENGMLSLLKFFISKTSILLLLRTLPKFVITQNVKHLMPLTVNLEIPKSLTKGSTVYLQNIVTDLILGLKRFDLLETFSKEIRRKGYKPGLITLNPLILDSYIKKSKVLNKEDVTICFNINQSGFNVFPNKESVNEFAVSTHKYKLMGMSIFSSGGGDIEKSTKFIKSLKLNYAVFGSSKLVNIQSNINSLSN